MKYICGLLLGKRGRHGPCGECFESFNELAAHVNNEHRTLQKIKGGNQWKKRSWKTKSTATTESKP